MAVNHDGFLELLDQTDQKHTDAHQRLRSDLREFETRLEDGLSLLKDGYMQNKAKIAELEKTPVDVTKLVLTPKIVAAIVFAILGVAGGMWATTSGLRSDMRHILQRMETDQRVADVNAKLLEVNNTTIKQALDANARELKESISSITKRQELQQLQIQAMQESIIRLTPQERR